MRLPSLVRNSGQKHRTYAVTARLHWPRQIGKGGVTAGSAAASAARGKNDGLNVRAAPSLADRRC